MYKKGPGKPRPFNILEINYYYDVGVPKNLSRNLPAS